MMSASWAWTLRGSAAIGTRCTEGRKVTNSVCRSFAAYEPAKCRFPDIRVPARFIIDRFVRDTVLPVCLSSGFDEEKGMFVEELTLDGKPLLQNPTQNARTSAADLRFFLRDIIGRIHRRLPGSRHRVQTDGRLLTGIRAADGFSLSIATAHQRTPRAFVTSRLSPSWLVPECFG